MPVEKARAAMALPKIVLPQHGDEATFVVLDMKRGCRVEITWSDGEEGPAIAFASRRDAEIWIERDARDWLSRLAAITPRSA